ncbi:hypothetical protein [Parasutterella secunda]|uniref:hypothetical protein n=1 Tax=Parasutterella secunda TaxID=626947 RepID=UPI0025A32756|nr:hypothetical protein [Parasutterella secunda]MDM8227726.1 hypothetical protein [Parasutterella secunda]
MENYYKLMELDAGRFGMIDEERSIFLKKMPDDYPENIGFHIDDRFADDFMLKDWYQSAMKKWKGCCWVDLTYGEVIALRAVIVSCEVKLPKDMKDLFCGQGLYFHVLKAADRFVSTILPLLPKKETLELVEHYQWRAHQFKSYAKEFGSKK